MASAHRRAALAALVALTIDGCTREPSVGFRTVELVHRIDGRQERETVTYGEDGVRYVRPDGTYLFRYADRTVFALNDADKTYVESSLEEFLARQKEREMQADVPDLVGPAGGGGLRIDATGQKTSIADTDARLTTIHGERFDVELWLADGIEPPGPRRPTFEFLQALGGPLALPAVLFDHVQGFPVRSIVRVKAGPFGEIKVTRALVTIERAAGTADAFGVPEGYRKAG